jgi:hypothetical protein
MSPAMSTSWRVRSPSAQHLVDRPPAVVADRGVERHVGPPRPAQELVDRLAEHPPLDVPQCDVEPGERARYGPLRPQLDALVQQFLQQDRVVERVLPDQEGRHVPGDDDEGGEPALHRRRLAHADDALVGFDADERRTDTALWIVAPFHLEWVDPGDFHDDSSGAFDLRRLPMRLT